MSPKLKIIIISIAAVLLIIIIGGFVVDNSFFGAPESKAGLEQFTIPMPMDRNGGVLIDFVLSNELKNRGFIKSVWGFNLVLGKTKVEPGAYKLSKSMSAWQIADVLKNEPYMKWVVIPEGWRKEQIAELLARELGWDDQQKSDWVTKYTAMDWDHVEGVYFPDTYLIPKDESGLEVAKRLINKFNEELAPYSNQFLEANIKWDTALKIASIIQREAAGKEDMPLIAGVIWNRLLNGMKLEMDATLQYVRDSELAFDDLCKNPGLSDEWQCQCGEEDDSCYRPKGFYKGLESWWTPITVADKKIDSSYNTYIYKGLPPHPINSQNGCHPLCRGLCQRHLEKILFFPPKNQPARAPSRPVREPYLNSPDRCW